MSSQPPVVNFGGQPLEVELPGRPSFARRIQRAHDLASRYRSASELLTFYAQLAFHQEDLLDHLRAAGDAGNLSSAGEQWLVNLDLLLPELSGFARSVAQIAPSPMGTRAAELAIADAEEQGQLLAAFWEPGFREQESAPVLDRSIAVSFLQPYAELLASLREGPSSTSSADTCPICDSRPVCAVLRDRAHGAGRSLVCSLCMHEWSFPRVACPKCGEHRFDSLAVFASEHVPHVRIDACDSCRCYIKTIDMTKDGLSVPAVDELAAISLDLWAADRQYRKLVPNLLGL